METQEITLDSLIATGRAIIESMRVVNRPNVISVYTHYNFDNDKYMEWEEISKRFLSANYPADRICKDFEDAITSSNVDQKVCIKKMVAVLSACKCLPKRIEKISDAMNGNIGTQVNVTNNNTLSQSQQLTVEIFIEAIKDDLTGKQVKELKEIVSQEGEDLEKAKPKILEKVISWGGNVAAGIVTNLITNPSIWGGL